MDVATLTDAALSRRRKALIAELVEVNEEAQRRIFRGQESA